MGVSFTLVICFLMFFAVIGFLFTKKMMHATFPLVKRKPSNFGAYLVAIALIVPSALMTFNSADDNIILTVLFMLIGCVLSFFLCGLLMGRFSVKLWLLMSFIGCGLGLRIAFFFIGMMRSFSAEYEAYMAPIRAEQEAQRMAAQQRQAEENERFQDEMYRRTGTRGQMNSDGTMWRSGDSGSWESTNELKSRF